MREVCPGVLPSGQLTENHPLVNAYIDALARLIPREPKPKPLAASSASSPASAAAPLSQPDATALPQHKPFELTYWVAHHAGIASTLTVNNVISQQFQLFPSPAARLYAAEVPKLSQAQKEAIFTLAALKVMNHPRHPAHFAFWGKNILERTAQVVDSVVRLRPCPIVSNVGWMGIPENTWALGGLQSLYIPAQVVPQKKAGGMTLRKRKASGANAEDEVDGTVAPRKRTRTTRASQKAKAAQAALVAAEVASAEPEAADEESESLLFPSGVGAPDATELDALAAAVSRDVKQEFIATTPVLQAIGLMLELPSISSCELPPPALPGSASPGSEPAESPHATRRSTRARRKPAPPGPCSLVSTPLSTVDTPLPSTETLRSHSQIPEKKSRNRSGSRGSSTAVSDGGYPSEEGTVVGAEIEEVPAKPSHKRKAVDEIVLVGEEDSEARVEPVKASKRKAKKPRAPKRAKVEEPPAVLEIVENVPAGEVAAAKKRKSAAGGGGKRKATRKA
ncbi:hypothetical protein BD310DRAFT_951469 [Dichomitus squalens]|uniref:Uncharacterized protein n=1 Tax=Dichomitus squalens TaxID=114155 RepID=A0A4Q9PJX5_9APHY|nr:hypothetical protein BD310DRAFT_951469 [Dichomitus squalens]